MDHGSRAIRPDFFGPFLPANKDHRHFPRHRQISTVVAASKNVDKIMRRTRVLIIDDHEKVLAALLSALEEEPDLEVTGTAGSTDESIEDALRFEPDVVLLDVKRSDGGGTEICRKIVQERPSTRVLVLTSYPDEREKENARAMGAVAYLLKDLDVQQLLRQIKAPRSGGTYEPREVDR